MFFSIIIPAYNAAQYLGECLDSVISQTFSDYEVILVDDGSTDSTPEIALKYKTRISSLTIINRPNQGALLARQTGVDAACGEYCLFLDADDFWPSNDALEVIHNALTRSRADLVVFNMTDVNTGLSKPNIYENVTFFAEDKLHLFRAKFLQLGMINMVRKCVRRELLLNPEIDYAPYSKIIGEDLLMSFFVLNKARTVVYLPDCLYCYRRNDASKSFRPVHKNNFHLKCSPVLPFYYFAFLNKWIVDENKKKELEAYGWHWFYVRLYDAFSRLAISEPYSALLAFIQEKKLLSYVGDCTGAKIGLSGLSKKQQTILLSSNKPNAFAVLCFWARMHLSHFVRHKLRRA